MAGRKSASISTSPKRRFCAWVAAVKQVISHAATTLRPWQPVLAGLVFLLIADTGFAQTNEIVFSDAPQNGWQNWSWAATVSAAQPVHSGAASLKVTAGAWQAVYFHHDPRSAALFTNISFWINGGTSGGQLLQVQGELDGQGQTAVAIPALAANTWKFVSVPLSQLGLTDQPNFDGVWVQDRSGTTQPAFFIDDVLLVAGSAPPPKTNAPIVIAVDAALDAHPISPLIYGVAFGSASQLQELNVPLNRSGGNSESRYNWKINAHNHAADYYFESIGDDPAVPGAGADAFVKDTLASRADAMITVPMVGWAPKLATNRGKLGSYSIKKYGPQTGNDSQWFPDAGNGVSKTNKAPIVWNDPNDANVPADTAFQQPWVQHLTTQWGGAGKGGVRYYLMDNEVSLWQSTHRDIHPIGPKMAEIRDKIIAYGTMVKSVDTNALVVGPEEWGWNGYFYSGYDQQAGSSNNWSKFPDREANGGWEYLPWILDQLHKQELATGKRLLDVFTVHYYPQSGEDGTDVSSAMQALRNKSTRSLWDTNYVDASWINDKVGLLPRLKNWVAKYYPGTKIGLTEYSWGAEAHISGALAQADVLGILGREGIDMATRWTVPTTGTPAYNAIKIYRNYDGQKSTFGDHNVRATGPNPDTLSAFAAVRTADNTLTLMLINKQPGNSQPVDISVTNFPGATASLWHLTSSNQIARLPDMPVTSGKLSVLLPAQSITLVTIQSAIPPTLKIRASSTPNGFELWVGGAPGVSYVVQRSPDLSSWLPWVTNTVEAVTGSFVVGLDIAPARSFYRAGLVGN